MAQKQHLGIYNPHSTCDGGDTQFHPFPRLPFELRAQIWQHALCKERRLNILLIPKELAVQKLYIEKDRSMFYSTLLKQSNSYLVLAFGCQTISKFMRVNQESRAESERYYRVKIPCKLVRNGLADVSDSAGPFEVTDYLYFNPEHDFLRIDVENQPKDTLADFLSHLKTLYDPRGVGLLRLMVDLRILHFYKELTINSQNEAAFRATMLQLEQVFLCATQTTGRLNLGLYTGVMSNRTFFNHSFPVMARAPVFERLGRDPRTIKRDLGRIFLARDPEDLLAHWQQLLHQWKIVSCTAELYFLISISSMSNSFLYTVADALSFLEKENVEWNEATLVQGSVKEDDAEEEANDIVKTAIGFWLFPVETFRSNNTRARVYQYGQVLDITEHWPELAINKLL